MTISRDSVAIRLKSQGGALPVCSGSEAIPVWRDIVWQRAAGIEGRLLNLALRCPLPSADSVPLLLVPPHAGPLASPPPAHGLAGQRMPPLLGGASQGGAVLFSLRAGRR